MSKPDPYGDWILFPTAEGESKNPPASDNELILAAREVWPRVLAHAQKELNANGLGSDSASMAAHVWEQTLRSFSRTRQRNTDHRQPIADLQSYLFLAFVHRFNRAVQKEQKHGERVELVSSSVDLERIESAQDADWVEELEQAIAIREIADRMDGWTRKVWRARQLGYTWKEVASWLGVSEQQVKMMFFCVRGVDCRLPGDDLVSKRGGHLAILAYHQGKLSEGQLARFLRTDRVATRMQVEKASHRFNEEGEEKFTSIELDLAAQLDGK
jgi:hypothetical protein